MSKLLVVLFVAFCALEVLFCCFFVGYASWKIPLLQIIATALLGLAVIRYLYMHLEQRVTAKLVAGEFLGDALVDAILIFLAGVLLIVPGIISDVAGLILLIPPVRWLIVGLLRRRHLARARAMREEFADLPPSNSPAGDDHSRAAR